MLIKLNKFLYGINYYNTCLKIIKMIVAHNLLFMIYFIKYFCTI